MALKSAMWTGEIFGVHVELDFNDGWTCELDGQGTGSGCQHVFMARSRARNAIGGFMDDFHSRAAITIMSLKHAPKPKKRTRVVPTAGQRAAQPAAPKARKAPVITDFQVGETVVVTRGVYFNQVGSIMTRSAARPDWWWVESPQFGTKAFHHKSLDRKGS